MKKKNKKETDVNNKDHGDVNSELIKNITHDNANITDINDGSNINPEDKLENLTLGDFISQDDVAYMDDYINNSNTESVSSVEAELQEDRKKSKGVFNKFFSFLVKSDDLNSKNNKLKKDTESYSYEYSKFKEYLFLLEDTEDDRYALETIEHCDNNLKLARHRLHFGKKLLEYDTVLEDLKCYENLTDEETEYFKQIIKKYLDISIERKSLRYQMGDFNSSINRLETLEQDALDAIYQIEEAENSKTMLQRDIAIIQEEKEKTINDREKLVFAFKLVYKFSVAVCVLIVCSIVILVLISVASNQNMFMPLAILTIVLIFILTLIYGFRKKINFELKLNEKKQQKIIKLLNKKVVVYSHYVNFLNYTYNKYKVKNSRVLKTNLKEFSDYKYILKRYDNLGKILNTTQETLEYFLKEKQIKINSTSLEGFAKSMNIDNKMAHLKDMSEKRKNTFIRLEEIEAEYNEVWQQLQMLNSIDTSKEKVVDKIIKAFLVEVERIVDVSEDENKDEDEDIAQ